MTDKYAAYLDYLESSHWRTLRQDAFNRANKKCEVCRSPKLLRGHHLLYREDLTACTLEDIMALCEPCHDIWHTWLKAQNLKVGDFCRQSTRGGILVLLSIPKVATPKAAKPKVAKVIKPPHLADKIAEENKRKLLFDLQRREGVVEAKRKERMRPKTVIVVATQIRQKKNVPNYSVIDRPDFQEAIVTSATNTIARRRAKALASGMPFRKKIVQRAIQVWKAISETKHQ